MTFFEYVKRRARFNLWYLGKPPWDTGITPHELVAFIANHPPGRALDLGCGTGLNVAALVQAGWQAVGVDYADLAVRAAKRRFRMNRIVNAEVFTADVTRLGWLSGPFDLVLDIGCYHSLNETGREAYRNNLLRLLGDEGTFLLYGHLKTDGDAGTGVGGGDLTAFARRLRLVDREDGSDRGVRKAAWLTYRRLSTLSDGR